MRPTLSPPKLPLFQSTVRSALATCVFALAASAQDHPTGPVPEKQNTQGDTLFDTEEVSLPEDLQSELEHVDPSVAGWTGEVFQGAAKKALKGLFHGVLDEGQRAGFEAYISPKFLGATSLRPGSLTKIFDDGTIQAYRMPAAPSFRHPPEELGRLLTELLAPYKRDSQPSMSLKVITIDQVISTEPSLPSGYQTEVLVQLDGVGEDDRLQQNFTWLVRWAEGEDQSALILSIILLEFTEVHSGGNMFSEVTDFMFGGLPFYETQVLQGVDDYVNRFDSIGGGGFLGSQGASIADINGDGLPDIYLCQEGGISNRLLLHNANGTLTDVSAQTGTGVLDMTRSALIVDIDADGDKDLLLAIRSDVLILYNDGKLKFGEKKWLRNSIPSDIFSMAVADPDADGDLDIYACRHMSMGSLGASPVPFLDANNGSPNLYWRNDGQGNFTEAAKEVGLDQNNMKFSFAAVWDDFDGDDDLDLFVSNDFGRNNLYRNDGGQFVDVGHEAGIAEPAASMGVSCSDIDLDGDMDVLISNMFSAAGRRTTSQSDKFMVNQAEGSQADFARTARGNTLLVNRGDGHFDDKTEYAGVELGRWAWGSRFIDFNNDGYEDMYVPNGFVTNKDPHDL